MAARLGFARGLMLFLLIGLALRLLALWFTADTLPVRDELDYFQRAKFQVEGRTAVALGKRAPGTIWLYAHVMERFGTTPVVPRVTNVLLGGLAIVLTGLLGRRFAGDGVGLTAAAFTALYPNFIFYSFSLWPAPVYLPLALAAFWLLSSERPGFLAVLVAGALMGAGALTKEAGTILPAIGGLWLLVAGGFRSPRAWIHAVLLGVAFLAVVLPWSRHQTQESGDFALITHTRWMNLYLGNVPHDDLPEHREKLPPFPEFYALGSTLEERETAARPITIQAIKDRMPWWPVEKVVEMVPRAFSPTSLPTYRLLLRPGEGVRLRSAFHTKVDGTAAEGLRDVLAYTAVAAWVFVFLAGSAGLALTYGRRLWWLFALMVGLYLLPIVVTFGMSRFRLPMVPVFLIAAAWMVREGAAAWRSAARGRRIATVVAVAVPALILVSQAWHVTALKGY